MDRAGIDPGIARQKTGKAGRNVSRLSFHSLRHSLTSALANAGVPAEIRQKLTGHADVKAHAAYSHHEFETIRQALDKVSRLPENARILKWTSKPGTRLGNSSA
jgi:integrase